MSYTKKCTQKHYTQKIEKLTLHYLSVHIKSVDLDAADSHLTNGEVNLNMHFNYLSFSIYCFIIINTHIICIMSLNPLAAVSFASPIGTEIIFSYIDLTRSFFS